MCKRLLSAILVLVFTNILIAQKSSLELPDYHPVSPNAASLGNYGLYPVNKNLGNTSISIPIYTISENKLSVPINLSYNASGIRLNDLASWVGLGWTLNAGGAIVRNVKGQPDIAYNSDIPNLQNFIFNQTNYDYLAGTTTGVKDTAPDQYVLNALGRSATFYFDQNNGYKAVFEDGSPIKINVISTNEMHAILEDGTLLKFGTGSDNSIATEETKNNTPNSVFNYVSTWYLTELISKDRQDTISFKYKSQGLMDSYSIPVGESIYINGSFPNSSSHLYLKAAFHELTEGSRKILEKIEFTNGYVDFESTLTRQDLSDDYKLDAVKVYFNDGTTNGRLVDQYHFTYDYFLRSGGVFSRDYELAPVQFSSARQKDSREKSMKLLNMYRGASASLGQVHSFEYNSATLPIRCTTAQDAWGYCNTNTGTLLPQTVAELNGVNTVLYTVGNGNRSADETKMKAAVLEKITYPTGGHTVFEHEANRFNTTAPILENKSFTAKAYGDECTGASYPHYKETTFTIPVTATNIKLTVFTSPITHQVGSQSYVSIDTHTFYRPTPNSSGGSSDSSDGSSETIDLYFNQGIGDPLNPYTFLPGTHTLKAYDTGVGAFGAYDCSTLSISISWDEPNGTQQVDKIVGGLRIKSISNYDGVSATPVQVKKYEYASPNLIQPERNRGYIKRVFDTSGGSLRLASSVSTSAHFNNNLGGAPVIEYNTVTEYDYDPVTGNKNGKIISNYLSIPNQRIVSTITGASSFKHPEFSWAYYFSNNLINGNLLSVSDQNKLLEAVGGMEELSFYQTRSWKRGKLLNEETYKRDGSNDVLVAKTENTYETIESLKISNNIVFTPFQDYQQGSWTVTSPYNPLGDFHSIQFSYLVGETEIGRNTLKQTKNTTYDEAGLNPVVTTTDYFYDNLVHKQVTRTKTTTSNGKSIIRRTFYPDDVTTTSSLKNDQLSNLEKDAIERLKTDDLHHINTAIQTSTYEDVNNNGIIEANELLSVQRTNYYEPHTSIIVPKEIQTLKGTYNTSTNTLEDRITFKNYYADGHVEELSKADGTSVYYIWGYNKQHPIAKLENCTKMQATGIQSLINTAVTASNNDTDSTVGTSGTEGSLRSALDAIRTHSSLSNTMVTTYTYDPLIGITSMTDPSGYTSYYVYDGFNRLRYIKNKDGEVQAENKYHYKLDDILATTTASSTSVNSGDTVTLTTNASGGTGNFAYKWTVSNGNLNQVFNTSVGTLNITTTASHTPSFTVTCEVTDTTINESVSTVTQIDVSSGPPPLSVNGITVSPTGLDNKSVGQNVTYSVTASGGSGNYSYVWKKTNSQSTVTYPGTTSSSKTIQVSSSDCFAYTITCTVTDTTTNEVVSKLVSIIVDSGCSGGPGL